MYIIKGNPLFHLPDEPLGVVYEEEPLPVPEEEVLPEVALEDGDQVPLGHLREFG